MYDKVKELLEKEQDYISFFNYNSFLDLGFFADYKGLNPKDITKEIIKNPELLEKVKTGNLLLLIHGISEEDLKELVFAEMDKRTNNGENIYYCTNFEAENPLFNFSTRSRDFNVGKERIEYYKNIVVEKIKNIDNKELQEMLYTTNVASANNFFQAYELGIFNEEKINTLKKIYEKNNILLKHINYMMFMDDIYSLGEDLIIEIARETNLTGKLIVLHDNNKDLFDACINIIKNNSNKQLQTRLQITEHVISYAFLNHDKYNSKIEDLDKFTSVALNNYYKYQTIPNGKILIDYYEDVNYDDKIKATNDLEEVKNIFCNKHFSLSLEQTKNMLDNYLTNINDIKDFDDNNKYKNQLLYMQSIINSNDVYDIKREYINPKYTYNPIEIVELTNTIIRIYSQTFTYVLNRTDDAIKFKDKIHYTTEYDIVNSRRIHDQFTDQDIIIKEVNDDVVYDSYNGKDIKIIPMDQNFSFIVTSTDTGFMQEKSIQNNSFIDTYRNIEDTRVDKLSTVYLNDDNLGITPLGNKGVYYAYTNLPSEFINIMGSRDVNSFIKNYSFGAKENKTYGARSITDNIRQVYGEVVIQKTNPDYILLFNDASDEVIVNSYKAASEWNIPIVYIDKRKVLKNQIEMLNTLTEIFGVSRNIELLEEIVVTYESNVSGYLLNRDKKVEDDSHTSSINNENYSEILSMKERVEEIVRYAIEFANEKEIEDIISLLERELKKYENQSNLVSKTEISFDAVGLIEEAKNKKVMK